ncbi:hypothetical protein CDAR_282731 [Caerostris darwini]|uniref:Uncharacterized protein n=1 Tax=Caerostris darwini TaxID=1538125 RepID=A0AAV4TS00_9ARAC|nr:hypothetical protein CDAR_282731 [Caerostris darwini]
MSKDQRIADKFGETFKDEEEDPALFVTLRKMEVGHNIQKRLGTANVTSSETPADLFHLISGSRNPTGFDMGADNVQQSAEYFFLQPTSNKRISNTNDSLTGCKKCIILKCKS